MLQALSEQDENNVQAGGGYGRAGSKHDSARPRGLTKTPFGSSTGRKALGNITNTKQNSQRPAQQPQERKGLSKALPPLKAAEPLSRVKAVKELGLQTAAPPQKPSATEAICKLTQKAQQLAKEGIEARAGKGWHEQEADRELRMQQDIQAKVDAICSRRYPLSSFMTQVVVQQQYICQPVS